MDHEGISFVGSDPTTEDEIGPEQGAALRVEEPSFGPPIPPPPRVWTAIERTLRAEGLIA